jgi:hypothetical protein
MSGPTIWKFPVPIADEFAVVMPKGALVLTVQAQAGEPVVWAIVSPDAPKVQRWFHVRGTGHETAGAESMPYVGTFQVHGGQLVFHLFDGGES